MSAVGRDLDTTDHGGVVRAITARTFVNGKLVLTIGAIHYCPIPGHGPNPMVQGSEKLFAEGMKVCRIGDASACGGRIAVGSPNTFDNG